MNTNILKIKREALLAGLKANRRTAAAIDRAAARKYKADHAAAVKARRDRLRELAKLPDAELAALNPYRNGLGLPDVPSCPLAALANLDRAIQSVEWDTRQTFTLELGDTYHRLLTLTEDPQPRTICDTMAVDA